METNIKTAKEFWTERFGEKPKTDSEKLAVAMMGLYKDYIIAVYLESQLYVNSSVKP